MRGEAKARKGEHRNLLGRPPLALTAWLLLLLLGVPPGAVGPVKRTVLLLTLDGVRWDYPGRQPLPHFARLAQQGAKAERLVPPFPSLTFVSHATLATGCHPDRHGIVANTFLDRETQRRFSDGKEAWWLREAPLWAWATRHGRRSAVAAWPTSQGDWQGSSARDGRPFGGGGGDEGTLAWIEELLGRPEASRPDLILAWMGGADSAGHREGPDGPAVRAAMERADRQVGRLLDFLQAGGRASRTTLLLASDHGMAAVTRTVDVVPLVPKQGYYPFLAISGPLCNVYTKEGRQTAEVARALRGAAPGVTVYPRAQVPASLRCADPARCGDFLLLAPPGTTFLSYGDSRSGHRDGGPRGMHGYDPAACSEMAGVFYAWGAGVAPGRALPPVKAVDVAPTACALIGLPPLPHADGKALVLSVAR